MKLFKYLMMCVLSIFIASCCVSCEDDDNSATVNQSSLKEDFDKGAEYFFLHHVFKSEDNALGVSRQGGYSYNDYSIYKYSISGNYKIDTCRRAEVIFFDGVNSGIRYISARIKAVAKDIGGLALNYYENGKIEVYPYPCWGNHTDWKLIK